MNKTLLTAASALAIITMTPAANAEEVKMKSSTNIEVERTQNQGEIPTVTENDIERGWENTKDTVSDAAEDVSDAVSDTYKDIKVTVVGSERGSASSVVMIDPRMTADGMIGKPLYNEDGERVAKIQDIILDSKGHAQMVVLADGAFTGLGKTVAFDYGVITRQNADGDVIGSVSEDTIDRAVSFSYDEKDASDKVRVMPKNGYSTAKLLEGHLVNPKGDKLADIDNISFRNGRADQLILGFDKTLGLGGEKAALAYSDAQLSKKGDSYDFKISANQAAQFEAFKNSF